MGIMHGFLRSLTGLDEFLLREDPDVCASAADELAYGEAMEALSISDGEASDTAYDADQDACDHASPERESVPGADRDAGAADGLALLSHAEQPTL